jgi:hypothetical protein
MEVGTGILSDIDTESTLPGPHQTNKAGYKHSVKLAKYIIFCKQLSTVLSRLVPLAIMNPNPNSTHVELKPLETPSSNVETENLDLEAVLEPQVHFKTLLVVFVSAILQP